MNTCCFIGHTTIRETDELKEQLRRIIQRLILDEGVDTFLFGSKSRFNDLCLEITTEFKQQYPHIRRVYVRAEYPVINEAYRSYLLQFYEDTYYPDSAVNSGRAAYVERNQEMIQKSRFCVIYCDETHTPTRRKSGAKIALEYARKQQKTMIRFPM